MASYRQVNSRRGEVWEIVGYLGIQPDGKRQRVQKRGFSSKRDAQQWFNREVIRFDNGESEYNEKESDNRMTINELYKMHIDAKDGTVQESTLAKEIEIYQNHVLPVWGEVAVDEIEPLALQKYINTKQRQLVHYKKVVGYLRRLVDDALRMGLIETSPFNRVVMPKERKIEAKKQFFEPDEFKHFIHILDSKYRYENQLAYTLLRLVAFTGIRREEVIALTWGNVDFHNGAIRIVQAFGIGFHGAKYLKQPKTAASKRTLPLDNMMIQVLADWYERSMFKKATDFVFTTSTGDSLKIDRPTVWLQKVQEVYGFDTALSLHKLRHTWGTLAVESGQSVKAVQAYLGHDDVNTTMNTYVGITADATKDTANNFTNSLFGKDYEISKIDR